MPAPHFVVTLTGGVDRLSSFLGSGYAFPGSPRDLRCRSISFQPATGNTHVVYGGGPTDIAGAALASGNCGWRLEIPVSTVPQAPFFVELGDKQAVPSDYALLGTAGEIVFVQLHGVA